MNTDRNITLIVVHCSATRVTRDYTLEQMERDHRRRGFKSAGYHFYILKSGFCMAVRPVGEVGAHAKGFNRESIGVCYEGGLDAKGRPADTRTPAQKSALLKLLRELSARYPGAEIVGHRDLSPDRDGDGTLSPDEWTRQCPCFNAKEEYRWT